MNVGRTMLASHSFSNSSSMILPDPHDGSQRTPWPSATSRTVLTGVDGCSSTPAASDTRSTIRARGQGSARSTV